MSILRVQIFLSSMALWFVSLIGQAQTPQKVYRLNAISVKSYDFKNFESFLKKDNDTVYVINFWATWCKPCIEELPHFEKLNRHYKDQNLKVILVSLDMAKQVETNLIPFIIKKKLQSDVILLHDPDANSWIEKVNPSWSGAIPATVIYNAKSRKFYEQSFTFEMLENEIKPLIH